MQNLPSLETMDVRNKTVVLREDFNVPLQEGKISNDARLRAALPTLKHLINANASIVILSHLDRPTEGKPDTALSLEPVAQRLSQLLDKPVEFSTDYLNGLELAPGQIILCENIRFNVGEKANDETLAKKLASLGDVFVMDAFSCAHRTHASTYGIAQFAKQACAGPLLVREIEALESALSDPERPLIAIVGGAKVSTKLAVLNSLIDFVDQLIVGGGMANTFLAAKGINVGASLCETDLIDDAKALLAKAEKVGVEIPLPTDVVVAKEFSATAASEVKSIDAIADDDMILDIGPDTQRCFQQLLVSAKTILWNGPVGVFEFDAFAAGTQALAKAIATSQAYSIAGGGDTLAAIEKFEIDDKVSYISTAGGAFLEFIENKTLPAIEILRKD